MTDEHEELSAKKLRKLEKNSDTRMLDPWERYRALIDLYEAFFDMNELADRKTRFALVMMRGLSSPGSPTRNSSDSNASTTGSPR